MPENPHFQSAESWEAARDLVSFEPRRPTDTGGRRLRSLSVFVMDHKMRRLAVGDRTLEAHYDGFGLSQARRSVDQARRLVVEVPYGRAPWEARIASREGRMYELGPEPDPDDIDGRSPAVVTWYDGDMHYLIASGQMEAADLIPIAISMYEQPDHP